MQLLRRYLILAHRYLGIALSLLFVVWFASGIVMIYAGGMPRLTAQERLERLPALDFSRVQLSPAQAAERSGRVGDPERTSLVSVMDRPAYRFQGSWSETVFADTGTVLDDISLAQSRTVASRFMNLPEDKVRFVRTLDKPDQWMLQRNRELPVHKFRVDDEQATEIYVSPRTAEVIQLTTRKQRALAWIGTIPHWLYFAALRADQPLWYKVVVWSSGLGCVLVLMGLILGFTQFRRTKPFKLSASIPYFGWMRWHYLLGAVFGVFALTWVFSGLLSMEPFAWTNATGLTVEDDVFTGGPPQLARFETKDAASWDQIANGRAIKELQFVRIQGQHYYVVRTAVVDASQPERRERLHQPYDVAGQPRIDELLVDADTLQIRSEPFSIDSLLARLEAALPAVPLVEYQLLSEYDSYYYSRGRQSPLPVLRVKFSDPAQTWFYIDPQRSELLAAVHKLNRVERWLYNGLHSLDFAFWYHKRPLWDIVVISLCLGGLATSCIGLFLGVKRLHRDLSRFSS